MYVTNGEYRCITLRVTKTENGVTASGYPIDYSILDEYAGEYEELNEIEFRALSDSAYQERLALFYAKVAAAEGTNFSTYSFTQEPFGQSDDCTPGTPLYMYGLLYNKSASLLAPSCLNDVENAENDDWILPTLEIVAACIGTGADGWDAMSDRSLPAYAHPRWTNDNDQTNTLALNILPAGSREWTTGAYGNFGTYADFWLDEEDDTNYNTVGFRSVTYPMGQSHPDPLYTSSNILKSGLATYVRRGLSVRLVRFDDTLADGVTGTVTDLDGNVYPTIKIVTGEAPSLDGYVWMCQNLKCTTIEEPNQLLLASSNATWISAPGISALGYYCYPNGNSMYV